MEASLDLHTCSTDGPSSSIRVAIIYDEFLSGARAKHFAERLAADLGSTCPLSESLWRSELLESPSIARQAARAAADCDYFIVSLRGDRVLGLATRQWIEEQLNRGAERPACVIALLDSDHGNPRILDANRRYLRSVCAAHRVEFFSHAGTPQAQRAAEDPLGENGASRPDFSARRCLPAPLDD